MTAQLRTRGDLTTIHPAAPAPASDAERVAAIEKWSTMPTEALLATAARQAEAWQMLDDAERALAVLELRPELERLEQTAAAAAALVPRAEQYVQTARQALDGPDAEVGECERRIADLQATLAASPDADMATLKTLHQEIAAYRETLQDLRARRIGPADQLAAAQSTLRGAQAAAAKAAAAVEACRANFADPLRARGQARLLHIRRTCGYLAANALAGGKVDAEDFLDARSVLWDLFVGLGFDAEAERRGYEAALREVRGLPAHRRG